MEYQPLVSIIVPTYNSAPFIIETLESVRRQTYTKIELIIADDCSTDNTRDLCRNWINENKDVSFPCVLVESKKNGGIVPNCNNGLFVAKGEWIKLIGGDDILLENCIEDFVGYVRNHRGVSVVFSNLYTMNSASEVTGGFPSRAEFFTYSPEKQLSSMLYENLLAAPAGFINKEILLKEGGFDPAYPMMEDYPLWIKLLSKGYQMGHLDKIAVQYRISPSMVSYNPKKMNPVFVKSCVDFARNIRLPMAEAQTREIRWKVRRDIALISLKQNFPFVYRLLLPVLWRAWNVFKKIKNKQGYESRQGN